MLVKYIDKYNVKYANYKRILKYNSKQVINPRDEDFIKAGYKSLVIDEEPKFNIDTQYLQSYYLDENDRIIQKYEVKEMEKIEESEV